MKVTDNDRTWLSRIRLARKTQDGRMGAVFGRKIRGYLAASSVAAFLMLAVACGSEAPGPSGGQVADADDNNPVLINTPGPVALLAPDFTLPSIDGQEYTLSELRGKQSVLVVFYRAYW